MLRQEIAEDRPRSWAALIRRDRRGHRGRGDRRTWPTAGWIVVDRPRRLWSRPRFHIADPRVLSRLHERVAAMLRSAEPTNAGAANDAALVALLAVGEVRVALPKDHDRASTRTGWTP